MALNTGVMELLNKLNRTDRRRFLLICRTIPVAKREKPPHEAFNPRRYFSIPRRDFVSEHADVQWLYKTAYRIGLYDLRLRFFWEQEFKNEPFRLRALRLTDYRARPVRERKDNKDFYNGRGGSGSNKIRFPKKVRSKGHWKRFYKLFPHLDPKNQHASS